MPGRRWPLLHIAPPLLAAPQPLLFTLAVFAATFAAAPGVTTPAPSTVELNPLPAPRDAVSFTPTNRAHATQRAWRRPRVRVAKCRRAARACTHARWTRVVLVVAVRDTRAREAVTQVVNGRNRIVCFTQVARLVGFAGLWMLDLAGAEGTAYGGLARVTVGRVGGSCTIAAGSMTITATPSAWDIQDVQLAASGRLGGKLLGRVMADMVAVNDVVVPIP